MIFKNNKSYQASAQRGLFRHRRLLIVIAAIVVIFAVITIISKSLSPKISYRSEDSRDKFRRSSGNAGYEEYSSIINGQQTGLCKVNVVERGSDSYKTTISADAGFQNLDIVGIKNGDQKLNIRKREGIVYVWADKNDVEIGYITSDDNPVFMRLIENLDFDNIDKEKSEFDCKRSTVFLPILDLPSIDWTSYN